MSPKKLYLISSLFLTLGLMGLYQACNRQETKILTFGLPGRAGEEYSKSLRVKLRSAKRNPGAVIFVDPSEKTISEVDFSQAIDQVKKEETKILEDYKKRTLTKQIPDPPADQTSLEDQVFLGDQSEDSLKKLTDLRTSLKNPDSPLQSLPTQEATTTESKQRSPSSDLPSSDPLSPEHPDI